VQARLEAEAQCLLVIIGATPEGKKELVGLLDARSGAIPSKSGVRRIGGGRFDQIGEIFAPEPFEDGAFRTVAPAGRQSRTESVQR
jgi:hypothetical protein